MAIINRIGEFQDDLTAWRRDLHAHPETAFEEIRTAGIVAEKLSDFGFDEVHTGIARTGVVGILRGSRNGARAIGLRADMDALPIEEATGVPWASTTPGKMHACGHDGHTTMLLGAARYLAETRNFAGTAVFIFQPAEENDGGGRVMVEEGLFERFPVEQVYGMHNWPRRPVGTFALRPGPVMAAADRFDIRLRGQGGHAAAPHLCKDPVVAGAELVGALQTVVARAVDPIEQAVVTVSQFHAGDAYNVIPDEARLAGTVRSFTPAVRDLLEARLRAIAEGIGRTHQIEVDFTFHRGYPPTINDAEAIGRAARVAADVVGEERVDRAPPPVMGAEDFAYMLEQKPGAYVFIGNGGGDDAPMLHNPRYDFNDEVLTLGASYWSRLVESLLPVEP